MKTVIPSIGSRGDVQPYIALARGLQAAGHAVTLASHPGMRGLVESYGVSFAPMGPDIDIGQEAAKLRRRSPTWMIGFIRVMKFSFDMLEQSHADILKLCQGVDFVIVPHSAGGSVEADQLGLRTISVTLMPQAIPVNDRKASALKRVAVKAMGAGMGLFLTRPLDQIRKRLGVPPMGPTGITSPLLNLIALSPQVIAPDPRWEERHKMTGYWFAPAPSAWEPPADLRAFLEADDPPVVVSLGAMALGEGDALETAHLVVEAVRQSGLRAVIQGWDEAMRSMDLPATIFHAGPAPHDWLLERASAVVHHGGFGTTAAGLRAGIPSLVIPYIIDQFLWGQRVYELGVGPRAIPRSKLTPGALAESLRQMGEDKEMRSKANCLGEKIRAERGVDKAVRLIEESLAA